MKEGSLQPRTQQLRTNFTKRVSNLYSETCKGVVLAPFLLLRQRPPWPKAIKQRGGMVWLDIPGHRPLLKGFKDNSRQEPWRDATCGPALRFAQWRLLTQLPYTVQDSLHRNWHQPPWPTPHYLNEDNSCDP